MANQIKTNKFKFIKLKIDNNKYVKKKIEK